MTDDTFGVFDPFRKYQPPARDDVPAYLQNGFMVDIDPFYIQYLIGVLERLNSEQEWSGDYETRKTMAQEIRQVQNLLALWRTPLEWLQEIEEGHGIVEVGAFLPYPKIMDPGTGWLPCDGTQLTYAEYPELAAVFEQANSNHNGQYQVDGVLFTLPNMNAEDGLTVFGANMTSGKYTGSTGGSETHTLIADETPEVPVQVLTHYDGTGDVVGRVGIGRGGAGVLGALSTHPDTKTQGGGQAHNNMPPHIRMYWHVLAKPIATVKGVKGDAGNKGDTGAQGLQGPAGVMGMQGPQGPPGQDGQDGQDCSCTGEPQGVPFTLPETVPGVCGLAVGLSEWLIDKFNDTLQDIQEGIAAANSIRNIVTDMIEVIPIFGDAIDAVLDYATDVAEQDINHLISFTFDVDWKEKAFCRLYCAFLGLPETVTEENMRSALDVVADQFWADPPEGAFLTLIGQAYSLFLETLSMRQLMRRVPIYINDVSDDCAICDCDEAEYCVFINFVNSLYGWTVTNGVHVPGNGIRTGTTEFALARAELNMPFLVELTEVIAEFNLPSSTPGATIGFSTDLGVVVSESDPGTGNQTLHWTGSHVGASQLVVAVDAFSNPTIKWVVLRYRSITQIDGEACP